MVGDKTLLLDKMELEELLEVEEELDEDEELDELELLELEEDEDELVDVDVAEVEVDVAVAFAVTGTTMGTTSVCRMVVCGNARVCTRVVAEVVSPSILSSSLPKTLSPSSPSRRSRACRRAGEARL